MHEKDGELCCDILDAGVTLEALRGPVTLSSDTIALHERLRSKAGVTETRPRRCEDASRQLFIYSCDSQLVCHASVSIQTRAEGQKQ